MHKAQRSRHNFCVCSFLASFGRRECAAERPDLLRQQQKKCRQRRRNSTQGVLPRMGPNFPKGKFSKRRSRKGFNFVCAKPPLRRAESRFAEPRFSLWEGFNFASAKPPLRRAEARFGKPRKVSKGFNFVSGKLLFGCADSRFAKPRCSSARERLVTFCVVQKVTKKHAGLRPATLIQISARFKILVEITGHHQVTGRAGYCKVSGYRR